MTAVTYREQLADADATQRFGSRLAACLQPGSVIYLIGDLGAGKTTLTRGLLRGLGYSGAVRSPTFTLIEPYSGEGWHLFHYDLYRLADPEELEYLGLREQCDGEAILLFEWPQRGSGWLPAADLHLTLEHAPEGRRLALVGISERGRLICNCVAHDGD